MSQFFSFVYNGKDIYYFNAEQRKESMLVSPEGIEIYDYDSHEDIIKYYNLDKNKVNKLTYNLWTEELYLDGTSTNELTKNFYREKLSNVNWESLAGDIKSAKKFLNDFKKNGFMKPDGVLEETDNIKIFKTYNECLETLESEIDDFKIKIASNSDMYWLATKNITCLSGRENAWDQYRNGIYEIVNPRSKENLPILSRYDAITDMANCAGFAYICSGLERNNKYVDKAKFRLEIWKHGYGLLGEINDVLYCYEHE